MMPGRLLPAGSGYSANIAVRGRYLRNPGIVARDEMLNTETIVSTNLRNRDGEHAIFLPSGLAV
jgi:hypothetical protein